MIIVSSLFEDIYQNFNVTKQIDKMKVLPRKELLLLLILASDSFSEESPIAIENFSGFKEEL